MASPRNPHHHVRRAETHTPLAPAVSGRGTIFVVMTVHVLHAGDGYTYLTRQVASGDEPRKAGQELADYYAAKGNPPGEWVGAGVAGLDVTGPVSEAQMRALFGEGLHPDAEQVVAQQLAAGADPDTAIRSARLGRRFMKFNNDGHWHQRLAAAYAAESRRRGGAELTDADRSAVRDRLARALFAEKHRRAPVDAAELKRFVRQLAAPARQPVAGYDLVFTPVKSVSVLWALGDDRVRREVEAAHRSAWRRALAYVQEHAALTRTGRAGVAQINTRGLVVAAFEHRDSRCGDPNLHTHCAVSTKVQGDDGTWRSLDGRVLHQLAVSASELYNTAVEDELRDRLGVRFVARPTGARDKRPVREIDGLPAELLEVFSQRRSVVEDRHREKLAAYRAQHGHEPPTHIQIRLAQEATLETRDAKAPLKTLAEQRGGWRVAAAAVVGEERVDSLVGAALGRAGGSVSAADVDVDELARAAVDVVSRERSTWTRWHVRAEAERQARDLPLASPRDRRQLVDAALRVALDRHSLHLAAPEQEEPAAELTRADGASVFTVHGADRYTSQEILAAEARLLDAARTPTAVGVAGATLERVREAHEAATGRRLDPGQAALARGFACDGRLVTVGIGPAGSGKTTAMRLFAEAWQTTGGRVIPLAPSARAAAVLGDELGLRAANIHHFLWTVDPAAAAHQDTPDAHPAQPADPWYRLQPGDCLLVDEAGMAGTRRLDHLVQLAAHHGAVVRLLGDPQQLAAVESGGALRLLDREIGGTRLHELHRFADPAEAAATVALRAGRPAALDFYEDHDRIREGSRVALLDDVYTAWQADTAAGRRSVMVAASNEDVATLAARARLDRVAAGQVELDGVRLQDGNTAGVGDVVVTRLNDRRLAVHRGRDHVKNGDTWRVLARRGDGALVVEHLDHHGRLLLPAGYVADHVELGYATTVHRVQGATVDTAHALIEPGLTRELLYVALTRGRHANHLYVVTDAVVDVEVHHPPQPPRTAREVLEGVLGREAAERSATETLRDTLAAADSLTTLAPEYEHAHGLLADPAATTAAVRAALPEALAAEVLGDASWPALAEVLRHTEAAGAPARDALARALAGGPLDDAESAAKVLHWRISRKLQDLPGRDIRLPEWVAAPPPARGEQAELRRWLAERADRIRGRVEELAERVAADRPSWAAALGECPTAGPTRQLWLRAAGRVAAYREQYRIDTDDPADPLGPAPEHPGRQARAWRAAEAWRRRAAEQAASAAAQPGTTAGPGSPAPRRAAELRRRAEQLARERARGVDEPRPDQPRPGGPGLG
jgi:conjugative relaxase-like TrwC/TraI family protein